MFGQQIKRPSRSYRGRTGFQSVSVELADERDVAHRVVPVSRAEIEIVDCECLLKDCWVWTLGKGHEYRIDVAHVVTADNIRSVGETIRMAVISRSQQQRGRIHRAAR